MTVKVWATFAIQGAVFAALLFGAAGTIRWLAGWAFVVLLFGASLLMTVRLARDDPALLAERLRPPIQREQPLWDRLLISAFLVLFVLWLVLMGLDAVRFGWSRMPDGLQWIGAAGVALSMWICDSVLRANTFLAPVVRIQAERGHKVISSGPYAFVRHPLYAGALLLFAATPLMLGSWFGLAAAIVLTVPLAWRTTLEDRMLQRELEGYRAYAERVRFRLVPLIW